MVCEEPIRASIWHALSHYAYDDAIFLAERLFAEVGSDDTLYLLATCFFQAGHCKRAYMLLQSKGCPTPLCRFLFAKCCMHLDKLAEAEMALTGGCLTSNKPLETIASEFGSAAGYGLALLGQICRKSEQMGRAAECFKSSLKYNPYLWSSFENLCQLGEKPDPADYFKSSSCPKITSSITQRESITIGSTTIAMDTSIPSENLQCNIDSVASENLDPSQNVTPQYVSTVIVPNVGSLRSSSVEVSGGTYGSQPSSVSIVGEKRIRQRVGRNLLGSMRSASPLMASFGMLATDSPSNDQNTFITPSPISGDSLAPKAPVKKVGSRRGDSVYKPVTTNSSSAHNIHTQSSQGSLSVRRSSRLLPSLQITLQSAVWTQITKIGEQKVHELQPAHQNQPSVMS